MESGDGKCAVLQKPEFLLEEMPTKKVLVRDEKIKQSPHCVVGQSDDASSTNIIFGSTEIHFFVFSLLVHAEGYFYRPSAIKQRRERLQSESCDMKKINKKTDRDDLMEIRKRCMVVQCIRCVIRINRK